MKPNCSETTAFSGRIFQKTSTPPLLPEKMRAPKEDRVLPALRDSSRGGDSSLPSFTSPCISTWPQKLSFLAHLQQFCMVGGGQFLLVFLDQESCLCPTSNSETFRFSFPNMWLRLATKMVSSSWGKAKVSVEKQVTFSS